MKKTWILTSGLGLLCFAWMALPTATAFGDSGSVASTAVSATAIPSASKTPHKKKRRSKNLKKSRWHHKKAAATETKGSQGRVAKGKEVTKSPKHGKRWVCPMDGYVSKHPGNCPRCGMKLVEQDY